ncbi:MAG: glucose 1-dehydrogenase [Alphaproteobacteria bacterium]|nr:MAG: glucose 1-dehydrogenase [Alphaproteobacteria bacterium]
MKNALVTGGGAGIGAAISKALADVGYRVGVMDINADNARAVAEGLPEAVAVAGDVTSKEAVDAAFETLGAPPDLVVNNAGIVRFGPLNELSLADFRAVVDVNLIGCFVVAQAAARRMAANVGGVIINLTSVNAINPAPNVGAYAATKAAIANLTQQMAIEWGPLGIRVNAIAPGFIDAGMSAPFFEDPGVRAVRGGGVPLKRLGLAEDIANAVVYLASDAASYVNGHQLVVDGGVINSVLAQLPREPAKD